MKMIISTCKSFILLFFLSLIANSSTSQSCLFKDTLFSIDFGAGKYVQEFNLNALKNYRRDYSSCPNDGFYSYASMTSNCFNDDWITLKEDHTPNDTDGKMMLVNASESAGSFFVATLAGCKPGTDYEFAVWMLNVCKINGGCRPLPPDILISLETTDGKKLAEFSTGKLSQSENPAWRRYYGVFNCPPGVTSIFLRMTNTTNGGCGNDFALDDITLRECYPPPPPVQAKKTEPATLPVVGTKPPANEPVLARTPTEPKNFKKNTELVNPVPVKDRAVLPVSVNPLNQASIPLPLLTRKNPVIKQIETGDADILVELYDNGEIDGDTVSIYHNNKLIVSHQGISEKPISFYIKVSALETYHEIVMVADNLGSIPPNTSLMIVTANGKRYEIFISSSEQNNAKIIIRKKE